MKKKLLLFIYFISFIVFSQQKTFQIEWDGYQKLATKHFSLEVPSFNKEYFSYDTTKGLSFISQWESTTAINQASAVLSNIQYEVISKAELKDLNLLRIPSKPVFVLKNSNARNKQFVYFELTPIIKEANGSFKKITAFTINYSNAGNNSINTARQNQVKLGLSNSVLNSGEWYKFYIDTTGVFKLSRNFLYHTELKYISLFLECMKTVWGKR